MCFWCGNLTFKKQKMQKMANMCMDKEIIAINNSN
uniref:Uncharacterized protein n=1 Tax=Tetranychus urticae TaxID=32264 RepID=T1JWQ0_TETUR